jgi:hypothetical protein
METNDNNKNITEIFGEVISSYSRKQAIEDGILCPVPEKLQHEAGFKFPIALTTGVYSLIEETERKSKGIQSYDGIVWDILFVLKAAIKRAASGDRINFTVRIGRKDYKMYSLCGPGDNMEPVITILLPNED